MIYIKKYFKSHKNILLFIAIVIIALIATSYLLASYATNVLAIHDNDDEYTITITENSSNIAIEAHSSVVVYYKIINTNSDTVQYAIGYTTEEYDPTDVNDTSLGVYIKGYDNDITGLIDQNETKFIKLKIFNQTDNDDIVNLSTILGYETGGNLILPSDLILVDTLINRNNAIITYNPSTVSNENSLFLGINEDFARKDIANITISDDSIVPAGYDYISLGTDDNSFLAWWTENEDDNSLVDLYIGSDYGKVIAPNISSKLFGYLTNAKNIDLSNLDTSNVTKMDSMFSTCTNLISLDLSNFDTSDVTTMQSMFYNCRNLPSLDLSSFNTSNVQSMYGMFQTCVALEDITFGSNFTAEELTNAQFMFYYCSKLKNADLSSFANSKLVNMNGMFNQCVSIESIDLSNSVSTGTINLYAFCDNCQSVKVIGLSKITNISNMNNAFRGNMKLANLDLSSANLSSITDYSTAFAGLVNWNANIYVKDSTEKSWLETNFPRLTNVIDVTTLNS